MTWNRILSLIISIAYLLFAINQDSRWPVMLGFLMLPLGCIWFGDELGGFIGVGSKGIFISETTPGIFVQIVGWLLLLMPAVILFLWR